MKNSFYRFLLYGFIIFLFFPILSCEKKIEFLKNNFGDFIALKNPISNFIKRATIKHIGNVIINKKKDKITSKLL